MAPMTEISLEVQQPTDVYPASAAADAIYTPRRPRRCSWFCLRAPWSASSDSWKRVHRVGGAVGDGRGWWWSRVAGALMKVRELSELVAGPRWKTFIRRFSRGRHGSGGGWRMGQARFQYDPLSYALNFDEGRAGGSPHRQEGDRTGCRDLSSRFVAPPVAA